MLTVVLLSVRENGKLRGRGRCGRRQILNQRRKNIVQDLPENHWRHIPLPSRDAELSLPNLKSLTTYFVKVNIRNTDGSVLRAPSLYRFTTIGEEKTIGQYSYILDGTIV